MQVGFMVTWRLRQDGWLISTVAKVGEPVSAHQAEDAIRNFWEASEASLSTSRVGAIRRGWPGQILVDAVIEELVRCGVDRASIHPSQPLPLPGAYQNISRPWDLLVIEEGMPVAAVEVITVVGQASGRNIRNRMDDILASGVNVFRAYDQLSVRALKPALGQVFLLEERRATTTPLPQRPKALAVSESTDPPKSAEGQLQDFFQRLLRDGMYDAVCYLMSQPPPDLAVREPDSEMGFSAFAEAMVARITRVREFRQQRNVGAAELGRMLAERDDVVEVVSGLSSTEAGRMAVDLDVIH